MSKKLRVGLVQMPVALGDREKNRQTVIDWLKQYYRPAELTTALALPELWDVGYALDSASSLADHQAEQALDFLGGLARKHGCWFTGGSVMAEIDGRYYNRSLVINPRGELAAHYDKAHLAPFITVEDGVFEMGDSPCVYDLDGIKAGNVICYDIRFPEWIRIYALRGVEILFVCSQWTRGRMDLFETMIRAHSIENMFYTVAVNNCGPSGTLDFGGGSLISDPSGVMAAKCSGDYYGHMAEIDLGEVEANRRYLKVIEKRRPALYRELI
jgi:predicted amidohydrolase